MATVKLTYLNYKGRAELLRFMLAQASVDFEDNRIEPEEWAEKMPGKCSIHCSYCLVYTVACCTQVSKLSFFAGIEFGLPVLECDDSVLQSNGTIAKFLAEKYSKTLPMLYSCVKHNNARSCLTGIGGCTADERSAAEGIVDATEETWNKMSKVFWEKDDVKKVYKHHRAECLCYMHVYVCEHRQKS